MKTLLPTKLKVADEVFLVVADLHRRNLQSLDFSIAEILQHARQMDLNGTFRPGVEIHVRQHCVANLPPNPGRYRMLYASSKGRRRLLMPGDQCHELRDGKIWPAPEDVPHEFIPLLDWAKSRYSNERTEKNLFQGLLELRGSGKELWQDEPADAYVERLREEEH